MLTSVTLVKFNRFQNRQGKNVNHTLRHTSGYYPENLMKPRIVVWISLVSALLTGVGHTAGGPMNEDLTPLAPIAQKAVDAGKQGDAEAFLKESQEALAKAKEMAPSASQQRIVGKLKIAVAEGKDGKLAEGVLKVEEAMSDMKKSGPPRFGGGS